MSETTEECPFGPTTPVEACVPWWPTGWPPESEVRRWEPAVGTAMRCQIKANNRMDDERGFHAIVHDEVAGKWWEVELDARFGDPTDHGNPKVGAVFWVLRVQDTEEGVMDIRFIADGAPSMVARVPRHVVLERVGDVDGKVAYRVMRGDGVYIGDTE